MLDRGARAAGHDAVIILKNLVSGDEAILGLDTVDAFGHTARNGVLNHKGVRTVFATQGNIGQ